MNGISMKEKKSFYISQNSMCHCIEIQANHWTQIFATFLMLMSMTTAMLHPETMDSNTWKLSDWTIALRLHSHAIYLTERVFVIVYEIYHA